MRVAYAGLDDLKRAIPDLSAEEIARIDFGTHTEDQFLDHMGRVTEFRCDPDLTKIPFAIKPLVRQLQTQVLNRSWH